MGSPAVDLGRRRGLAHFRAAKMGLSPSGRFTPYDVLRTILGPILLTAAALKGHQLATEPVAETGLLNSRWFLIGVVEFELFFGLWLLSALHPRRTWHAALLCFTAFAGVSLYKALSGEATCGCFGRVPVSPWYTLILDLAAVAGLFCFRPAREKRISPLTFPGEGPGVRAFTSPRPLSGEALGMRLGWVLGLFLAVGIPAALATGTYRPATIDDSGDIFGDSEFVVLEPETWVGKRFPLLKYIDIGDDLVQGEWVLVLYHHDCPNCQQLISEYQQSWQSEGSASSAREVALIELPPYGDKPFSLQARCRWGRLSDGREWFGATPLECALRDGFVSQVRVGGI